MIDARIEATRARLRAIFSLATTKDVGAIGTIATWLGEPEPRDRGRLERTLGLVYSNWLVPASHVPSRPDGHPSEGDPP